MKLEELLNDPYFGDRRELGHVNVRLLKRLCVAHEARPVKERSPTPRVDPGALHKPTHDVRAPRAQPAVQPTEVTEAAGTTAYVRGGLCLRHRVDIVKQIKASYDRVGIDVQDDEEAQPTMLIQKRGILKYGEYGSTILEKDSWVGHPTSVWSIRTFPARRTMATSIAADLGKRTPLSAEMDKEYGHESSSFANVSA